MLQSIVRVLFKRKKAGCGGFFRVGKGKRTWPRKAGMGEETGGSASDVNRPEGPPAGKRQGARTVSYLSFSSGKAHSGWGIF